MENVGNNSTKMNFYLLYSFPGLPCCQDNGKPGYVSDVMQSSVKLVWAEINYCGCTYLDIAYKKCLNCCNLSGEDTNIDYS